MLAFGAPIRAVCPSVESATEEPRYSYELAPVKVATGVGNGAM